MHHVTVSPWYRAFGSYRWMALVLATVLMATGFFAFTRDVATNAPLGQKVHVDPTR